MSDQHKGGAEDEGKEDGHETTAAGATCGIESTAQAVWLHKTRNTLRETLQKTDHADAMSFSQKVNKWRGIFEQAKAKAPIGTNAYSALCDICKSICAYLSDIIIEIPADRDDKVAETITEYHVFIDEITHYASCSELSQLRFAAKDGRNVEDPESQFLEPLTSWEQQMLFALYCMPDCVSGSKMWQLHDKILQDSLLCMRNTKYFHGCAGSPSVFELLNFQQPEVLEVVADGEVKHVRVKDDGARQYQQRVGETATIKKS